MLRVKAKVPDKSTLISALGQQALREAIAEDYFLSEQEASCCVVFHTELRCVVADYLYCGSRTAIAPINLADMRYLNGYAVMFRNGEF